MITKKRETHGAGFAVRALARVLRSEHSTLGADKAKQRRLAKATSFPSRSRMVIAHVLRLVNKF